MSRSPLAYVHLKLGPVGVVDQMFTLRQILEQGVSLDIRPLFYLDMNTALDLWNVLFSGASSIGCAMEVHFISSIVVCT